MKAHGVRPHSRVRACVVQAPSNGSDRKTAKGEVAPPSVQGDGFASTISPLPRVILVSSGKPRSIQHDIQPLWNTKLDHGISIPNVSPGGKIVVVEEHDSQTLHACDVQTGNELWSITAESGANFLEFSPDGKTLGTYNGHAVRLFEPQTGAQRMEMKIEKGKTSDLPSLHFSPDGRTVVVSHEKTLHAFDCLTGSSLWQKTPCFPYVSFSRSGNVVADNDDSEDLRVHGKWRVYDARTGSQVWEENFGGDHFYVKHFLGEHVLGVRAGQKLIRLDPRTGSQVWETVFPKSKRALETGSFGRGVFVVDNDATLHVLDVNTGQLLWKKEFSSHEFSQAAIASGMAVAVHDHNNLRAFHFLTGAPLWGKDFQSEHFSTDSSPDGQTLAAYEGNTLYLLDPWTGDEHLRKDFGASVDFPKFTPDGTMLFAGAKHSLYVFDALTRKQVWENDFGVIPHFSCARTGRNTTLLVTAGKNVYAYSLNKSRTPPLSDYRIITEHPEGHTFVGDVEV